MGFHQASVDFEPAIWARLIQAPKAPISPDAARYLLSIDFSEADHVRMQELMGKSSEGALTPEERAELNVREYRERSVGDALPGASNPEETRLRVLARHSQFVNPESGPRDQQSWISRFGSRCRTKGRARGIKARFTARGIYRQEWRVASAFEFSDSGAVPVRQGSLSNGYLTWVTDALL